MSSQLESYSHKSDSVKTGLLECSLSACPIYRPLNSLSTQSLCRNSGPLVTQATPWTMPSSPPLCPVCLVSPHLQPQLIRMGLASWPNQSLAGPDPRGALAQKVVSYGQTGPLGPPLSICLGLALINK